MNAYYQEGTNEVTGLFKYIPDPKRKEMLSSFSKFKGVALQLFNGEFVRNLNPKYNKKLLKRLSNFYKDLKKKYKA